MDKSYLKTIIGNALIFDIHDIAVSLSEKLIKGLFSPDILSFFFILSIVFDLVFGGKPADALSRVFKAFAIAFVGVFVILQSFNMGCAIADNIILDNRSNLILEKIEDSKNKASDSAYYHKTPNYYCKKEKSVSAPSYKDGVSIKADRVVCRDKKTNAIIDPHKAQEEMGLIDGTIIPAIASGFGSLALALTALSFTILFYLGIAIVPISAILSIFKINENLWSDTFGTAVWAFVTPLIVSLITSFLSEIVGNSALRDSNVFVKGFFSLAVAFFLFSSLKVAKSMAPKSIVGSSGGAVGGGLMTGVAYAGARIVSSYAKAKLTAGVGFAASKLKGVSKTADQIRASYPKTVDDIALSKSVGVSNMRERAVIAFDKMISPRKNIRRRADEYRAASYVVNEAGYSMAEYSNGRDGLVRENGLMQEIGSTKLDRHSVNRTSPNVSKDAYDYIRGKASSKEGFSEKKHVYKYDPISWNKMQPSFQGKMKNKFNLPSNGPVKDFVYFEKSSGLNPVKVEKYNETIKRLKDLNEDVFKKKEIGKKIKYRQPRDLQ